MYKDEIWSLRSRWSTEWKIKSPMFPTSQPSTNYGETFTKNYQYCTMKLCASTIWKIKVNWKNRWTLVKEFLSSANSQNISKQGLALLSSPLTEFWVKGNFSTLLPSKSSAPLNISETWKTQITLLSLTLSMKLLVMSLCSQTLRLQNYHISLDCSLLERVMSKSPNWEAFIGSLLNSASAKRKERSKVMEQVLPALSEK